MMRTRAAVFAGKLSTATLLATLAATAQPAPAPDPSKPEAPVLEQDAPAAEAPPAPAAPPAAEGGEGAPPAQPAATPAAAAPAPAAQPAPAAPEGTEPGEVFAPPPSGAPPGQDRPQRDLGPVQPIVNVALNMDTLWNTSRSFDLFSDDNVARQFGISGDVTVWSAGGLSIAPGIGWGYLSESDNGLFDGVLQRSEIESHSFYADLALRYEVWSFFEPHARLAGGASFVDVLLRTENVDFEDDGGAPFYSVLSPFATLGAGFTLKTVDRALETANGKLSTAALGVTVEGGYVLAAPLDLALDTENTGERIAVRSSTLGDVERSGPYLRLGIVGRL